MIHELAHFTGPVDGILDHAYFHKNPHRYRNLSHELAFGNADSYSQFAFETIGKPDFDASAWAAPDPRGHERAAPPRPSPPEVMAPARRRWYDSSCLRPPPFHVPEECL
jgi:hypothetical protein